MNIRSTIAITAYLAGWVAAQQLPPPAPSETTLSVDVSAKAPSHQTWDGHPRLPAREENVFYVAAGPRPASTEVQAAAELRFRATTPEPAKTITQQTETAAPQTGHDAANHVRPGIILESLAATANSGPQRGTDTALIAPESQSSPAHAASPPIEEDETVELPTAKPSLTQTTELEKTKPQKEAVNLPETAPKQAPLPPKLPAHLAQLKKKIHTTLDIYRHRTLNTRDHGQWSIMHSLIAYGTEKKVAIGGPGGRKENAIGWICFNYPCRGLPLFYVENDRIRGRSGPGRQGHEGQFLAMLAQSRVNISYPMKIEGRDLTIRSLVDSEMATCRARSELTFKLIGLAYYLDIDDTWSSDHGGGTWNIERLMAEELRQPVNGAACGGTHRLSGLAYGLRKHQNSGQPLTGSFLRAKSYLEKYHAYTFRLQNRDGSFSTEYFTGRGFDPDWKKRILTSGHIAEWLTYSLPEDQLQRPEMQRAMHYISNLLIRGRKFDWDVGPLGHALHALNMYDQRALQVRKPDSLATRSADVR